MAAIAVAAAVLATASGSAESGTTELTFDFETGPGTAGKPGAWTSGCFRSGETLGCLHTTGKGVLRAVPREDGTAIRFPAEGSAVIQVDHDDALNPGRADFTVSALVRLPPGRADAGANIVQKGGYDSARGQWKLQVDSGVPSCRVSGSTGKGGHTTAEVRAGRVLRDRWTALACVREGSQLRLYIDGVKIDTAKNADADVDNMDPVLIGGKHAGPRNDQFRGDLDEVRVDVTGTADTPGHRPSPTVID
ncbi:hypothetical protein Snas_2039 [Stackebrandtia nassauensis DSM 44728]|uniref:LamG-like jellyroll fold domain-containing protein n=1 Tax=Stackebrandtia nassauensis (strain DSM 44728 / CIP 108903 / NRRL B-16338 / NBRC 102104 / LLR-40K-21) TaxID=446470 RepID=D3Q0J8_STANL|nr:hypothetical protein Snas_2039 [Stackebrandtia nassauensis DSM 44728]